MMKIKMIKKPINLDDDDDYSNNNNNDNRSLYLQTFLARLEVLCKGRLGVEVNGFEVLCHGLQFKILGLYFMYLVF